MTQNEDRSRGLHLGNLTKGIDPGPFGGIFPDPESDKIYASTEQGIFVRNFNSTNSSWEQIIDSNGNHKIGLSSGKLILTRKNQIEVWDNELDLGALRRLSYLPIGQDVLEACKNNSIKSILSLDGKSLIGYIESVSSNCDIKTERQGRFVSLRINPNKKKISYNLNLEFAAYHSGTESKTSVGLISLPEDRIVLAFNKNKKGRIEIRDSLGEKLIYDEDYPSELRDIDFRKNV
ncbi:MAG: hypothetical protein MH321_02935 [Leptospiraceae bacterium]|nr:hypothetical protein [Leptospiraceae bacterium]